MMAISKPENASESAEVDDRAALNDRAELDEEAEHGETGREGALGYGYGYEGAGEAEAETERDRENESGHEPDSGLGREGAITQQTTTGAVNRDLKAEEQDEPDEPEPARDEAHADEAEEPQAKTLSTAEPAATIYRDEADRDLDAEHAEDSMSGEAVQTLPQSTPMQPTATTQTTPSAQSPLATDPGPVLAPESSLDFRERWHSIQAEFIDDPRRAVEDADHLVADVARAFASGVEERRRSLTSGWESDGHGETEELRLTMRQYRALVDHILHD